MLCACYSQDCDYNYADLQQAEAAGVVDRFAGVVGVGFFEDVLAVAVDGVDADGEPVRDVFAVQPAVDVFENLALSCGQSSGLCFRGAGTVVHTIIGCGGTGCVAGGNVGIDRRVEGNDLARAHVHQREVQAHVGRLVGCDVDGAELDGFALGAEVEYLELTHDAYPVVVLGPQAHFDDIFIVAPLVFGQWAHVVEQTCEQIVECPSVVGVDAAFETSVVGRPSFGGNVVAEDFEFRRQERIAALAHHNEDGTVAHLGQQLHSRFVGQPHGIVI